MPIFSNTIETSARIVTHQFVEPSNNHLTLNRRIRVTCYTGKCNIRKFAFAKSSVMLMWRTVRQNGCTQAFYSKKKLNSPIFLGLKYTYGKRITRKVTVVVLEQRGNKCSTSKAPINSLKNLHTAKHVALLNSR